MRISEEPSDANACATAWPRLPAAPVTRQVLPLNLTALGLCGRTALRGLRPVLGRGLGVGELARVLEARGHGRGGAGEHLVVVDVEQPQPALLAQREPDHAPELDELRFVEVRVHAFPEGIVGRR